MEGCGNEWEGMETINAMGLGEWKQGGCSALFSLALRMKQGAREWGRDSEHYSLVGVI